MAAISNFTKSIFIVILEIVFRRLSGDDNVVDIRQVVIRLIDIRSECSARMCKCIDDCYDANMSEQLERSVDSFASVY